MKRREFLQQSAAMLPLAVGASTIGIASEALAAEPRSSPAPSRPTVTATLTGGIVEISSGKIRGFSRKGIHAFRGVPYGNPTGGKTRFLPATKADPWTGVRSCLSYGPTCPWTSNLIDGGDNKPAHDEDVFLLYRISAQATQSENCLRANIWTPQLGGNTRRPVMVFMHGGGFTMGSSQDLLTYDGEALARGQDVVVITHNHRLNLFGYLNLSEARGEKYARSGNAGMLDIILLLEWVRDNAAAFGGDPNNVTVFGQSGGGQKISTLMAMPEAKGLFHKAIVESGSGLRVNTEEESLKHAANYLAALGLSAKEADKLDEISVERLCQANQEMTRRAPRPQRAVPGARAVNWGPTLQKVDLPTHPFDPVAPAMSAHIPLMVGSCRHEMVNGHDNPLADNFTESDLQQHISDTYGAKAQAIIAAYKAESPTASPFNIYADISASSIRSGAYTQAERQAANGGPVFQYVFGWNTRALDGRPGTFHSSELAFVFNNWEMCENYTGGDAAAQKLAADISGAWATFARTGNPSHPGIPNWERFSAQNKAVMFLDTRSTIRRDYNVAGLKAIMG